MKACVRRHFDCRLQLVIWILPLSRKHLNILHINFLTPFHIFLIIDGFVMVKLIVGCTSPRQRIEKLFDGCFPNFQHLSITFTIYPFLFYIPLALRFWLFLEQIMESNKPHKFLVRVAQMKSAYNHKMFMKYHKTTRNQMLNNSSIL